MRSTRALALLSPGLDAMRELGTPAEGWTIVDVGDKNDGARRPGEAAWNTVSIWGSASWSKRH